MQQTRLGRAAPARLMVIVLGLAMVLAVGVVRPAEGAPERDVQVATLQYGPNLPGNLLDLYVPDVAGEASLPLLVWHSGSAWFSNTAKDAVPDVVVDHFTDAGYAVAAISIRSSFDARFPAQGHDVRAAIRYLREQADAYGIDPGRFAMSGTSSGGWATAFAATTGDIMALPGETGVDGTSSAVQVAVPFFPPTDFLSMDEFAAENDLPMGFAYPHDSPTSPEGFLIHCPGEGPEVGPPAFPLLVSIQECPEETEAADPSTYIEGDEVPMWLLHGLQDPLLPFNQSLTVYEATKAAGNEARISIVPSGGHSFSVLDADEATTTWVNRGGQEQVTTGPGPTWDDIEHFIHVNLNRARR